MKLLKIALKTFVLLFVFCLGFILSMLFYADQQMDDIHLYVYDTEQKIEDYYKRIEKHFLDITGALPESPVSREFVAMVRGQGRPLVEVGPFAIFVEESGTFSVREIQSLMPLVELENHEQSKRLYLSSSLEKGWRFPRFHVQLYYSEDGIYKRGGFSVSDREDGTWERSYLDTKGTGVFDVMHVYDCENSVWTKHHLTDISWEQVEEQSFLEAPLTERDDLLREGFILLRSRDQVKHNAPNENENVEME